MTILSLKNFKAFRAIDIQLNQLTAFLGVNGAGKSSALQAMLLLYSALDSWQSRSFNKDGLIVPLNDVFGQSLGTSADVVNQQENDSLVTIGCLDDSGGRVMAEFAVDTEGRQLGLPVSNIELDGENPLAVLSFISAERLGPRVIQTMRHMERLDVGTQGEYTGQVLSSESGRVKVKPDRLFPMSKDSTLSTQINLWLDMVFPGVRVFAKEDPFSISSTIRIENQYSSVQDVLPTNIGFGISYVLPVITAGLVAETGSFLIIENPEAHLHPSAQSAIGEFVAMVARSGVKVIIETHSDHVINGIQNYAAMNPDFSSAITINNFSIGDYNQPRVDSISVGRDGGLLSWPEGFLDQAQVDYRRRMHIISESHV